MKDHVNIERKSVANPKNEMKPKASVHVVTSTADDNAGSIFAHFSPSGTRVPIKPAMNKLVIIARHITTPSIKFP
jgi:hypothetical protein